MSYQNIDASVLAADLQGVKDAFAVVLNKLPFLITLTVNDRKGIAKLGADSLSFVQNTITAVQARPSIFPASFDVAAFQRDFDLFAVMTELTTLAQSVTSQLDDTRLAVGGEAMQEASQAYGYIKAAAKTEPGLKPVAEQLGERFQRASKTKTKTAAKSAGTQVPAKVS
jgi:hypothetical protein